MAMTDPDYSEDDSVVEEAEPTFKVIEPIAEEEGILSEVLE